MDIFRIIFSGGYFPRSIFSGRYFQEDIFRRIILQVNIFRAYKKIIAGHTRRFSRKLPERRRTQSTMY
jgi:hypothetical protein